jgi:hypothetical protein
MSAANSSSILTERRDLDFRKGFVDVRRAYVNGRSASR